MEPSREDSIRLVKNSTLYKEFLAERDEILRHKWIESEKAGCDIGFERALMDWIITHRSVWLQNRRRCTQNPLGHSMVNYFGSPPKANVALEPVLEASLRIN